MNTVWKYELKIEDYQYLTIPFGAKLLCIKMQNEVPVLYALVNENEHNTQNIAIRCAGTGHRIHEDNPEYLGTIMKFDGKLVFHYFKI